MPYHAKFPVSLSPMRDGYHRANRRSSGGAEFGPRRLRSSVAFHGAGLLAVFALLAGCVDSSPDGFTQTEPRAFLSTLGSDTMSVEVFTRSGDVLEGTIVGRSPNTHVFEFSGSYGEDGTIDRLEVERTVFDENGAPNVDSRWTTTISDTTATVVRGTTDQETVTMGVRDDAIPYLGRFSTSMFVFEQVADQIMRPGAGEAPVQLVGPSGDRPWENRALVHAPDTVSMDFFGSPRVGWLTEDGMVLGASGAATTIKEETRRVPSEDIDLDALIERWVRMDMEGRGVGTPSPLAEISASVSGATITGRYSRPAVRGRDIWGALVPYDAVWRTGANAATHLTTDRDLEFEGLSVPAGTYTLWSTYSPGSGTLIINEQTNQWGTQYDADRDLGRVPLGMESLDDPVERFTIDVVETPDGGEIHLTWDRTRWSAPFRVN